MEHPDFLFYLIFAAHQFTLSLLLVLPGGVLVKRINLQRYVL